MELYQDINKRVEKLKKLMRFAELYGGKIAAGGGTITFDELEEIYFQINSELQAKKSEADLVQSKAFLRLVKVTK